jgi:hypothetical protein
MGGDLGGRMRKADTGFPHGRDQWISAAGTSWAASGSVSRWRREYEGMGLIPQRRSMGTRIERQGVRMHLPILRTLRCAAAQYRTVTYQLFDNRGIDRHPGAEAQIHIRNAVAPHN